MKVHWSAIGLNPKAPKSKKLFERHLWLTAHPKKTQAAQAKVKAVEAISCQMSENVKYFCLWVLNKCRQCWRVQASPSLAESFGPTKSGSRFYFAGTTFIACKKCQCIFWGHQSVCVCNFEPGSLTLKRIWDLNGVNVNCTEKNWESRMSYN